MLKIEIGRLKSRVAAGSGRFLRRAKFFSFFVNTVLTAEAGGDYTPVIERDAADTADAVRTISRASRVFRLLPAGRSDFGSAAKVVKPRRFSLRKPSGFHGNLRVFSETRCLTIESEEREAWTAEVLAGLSLGIGRRDN
jgi:hypothetical protein